MSTASTAKAPLKNREAIVTERYYDRANRRLIYIGTEASPEMWDALWDPDESSIRKALQPSEGVKWLLRLTRQYLGPTDGTVLEGGCGKGQYVSALQRAGYNVVGIDSAPQTVAVINRVAPHLDVRLGDVRDLPFVTGSLAGYWSLGLIEHFFSGYGPMAREMARVIRPGGFLFLSFPYMSPMRRLKARFGVYPAFADQQEPQDFYQFALDPRCVADEFESLGFDTRSLLALAGLKGLKDEAGPIRSPLQKLYHYPGSSLTLRGLRWAVDPLLAKLGCGHACVLVLQRR
jgi:SAM-dependent methyltransferase